MSACLKALRVNLFPVLQGWENSDRLAGLLFGQAEIVDALKIQPKLRLGHFFGTSNGSLAVQDLGYTIGRHLQLAPKFGRAHA